MEAYYFEIGLYALGGLIVLYLLFKLFFRKRGHNYKEDVLKEAHEEGAISKGLYKQKTKEFEREEREAAERAQRESEFERKKAVLDKAVKVGSLNKQDYIKQMYILDKERKKKH